MYIAKKNQLADHIIFSLNLIFYFFFLKLNFVSIFRLGIIHVRALARCFAFLTRHGTRVAAPRRVAAGPAIISYARDV